MKIDSSTARQLTAPRQSSAGSGASFTQLVEQGSSAEAVMSSRALGFAENGLLGIHAAVLSDPAGTAPGAAAPPLTVPAEARPQRFAPWGGPLLVSVADLLRDTAEPAVEVAPNAAATIAQEPGPALAASAAAPVAEPGNALASPAPQLALASDPAEPDLPAPVRSAWLRAADTPRGAGAVRFELHMLNQQLVAVVTDMTFGRLDEHDLTRIRDTAAREFGVTVGKIVIRPKPEISSGNQRGN